MEIPIQLNWLASNKILDDFTEALVNEERRRGIQVTGAKKHFLGDFFHRLGNTFYDVPKEHRLFVIPMSVPAPEDYSELLRREKDLAAMMVVPRFFGQIGDALKGYVEEHTSLYLPEFIDGLEALGKHFPSRLMTVTFRSKYNSFVVCRMDSGQIAVEAHYR